MRVLNVFVLRCVLFLSTVYLYLHCTICIRFFNVFYVYSNFEATSERDGDVMFQERGFLREAVAEFLSELGWTRHDDRSTGIQSLEELAQGFSLGGLNRNAVSVDEERLLWINKKHFIKRLQNSSSCTDLARQLAEYVKTTLR